MVLERFFSRRKLVYEGKGKIIYEGPEPNTYIQHFKDDSAAVTEGEKEAVAGKGVLNNRISAHIMSRLESVGIPTHFLRSVNMREQLVRKVEIIPIEVVVRNVAAGSFSKRLGVKEGTPLPRPLIEFYLKNSELESPLITEDHIYSFGWADPYEIDEICLLAWRINDFLSGMFSALGLQLVDFKVEFGRIVGEFDEVYILLADELSADSCRLWDLKSGNKLEKERFSEDKASMIEAYQDLARRLGLIPDTGIIQGGNVDEQIAAGLDTIENELANVRQLRSVNKGSPTKPWKS